jgi:bifunctional enzyme CysN/CysC
MASPDVRAAGGASTREQTHIVVCGHVDHGKSTIVGRLLADTGSLPQGKLEQVQALCARTSKPFEYAFLLDALKDERAQGITIDAARVFFRTERRDYLVLDAPGHVEFLKNMITGAAHAEAAFLVVDAKEGLKENSRRHGYLLSFLGIRQVAVLVNKMDLVGHDADVFARVSDAFREFLESVGLTPECFIPVSGRDGDNIAARSSRMSWYQGRTVVEVLDGFESDKAPTDKPFRMPVQDVYKFTSRGDERRIVAGTIQTGRVAVGDEVVFYPSGKKSRVKTLEAFNAPRSTQAEAGQATGFTLEEQIYVTRGELAALAAEPPPRVSTRLRVSLFWLGKHPLVKKKDYVLKLGSTRVPMRIEEIHRVMDASDLETRPHRDRVDRHEVAECTLRLSRAIAFDVVDDVPVTARFVIVDDHDIRGGGIVHESVPDQQAWIRDKVLLRNYKWEPSIVSAERRAERYSQRATLILVTGDRSEERRRLAKHLEARLFDDGKLVYFMGIANLLYGVDADIERSRETRGEHLRRLAEVANIVLDTGMILIITAHELTQADLDLIRTAVDPDRIETIWVGDTVTTDVACDLVIGPDESPDESLDRIKRLLQDNGVIFRCW